MSRRHLRKSYLRNGTGESGGGSATGEVGTQVAETVAPGSTETHSHESGPSNADILSRLDDIAALITSTVTTDTETAGEVEEPGNGDVIRDKSPASKPWTHKRILK